MSLSSDPLESTRPASGDGGDEEARRRIRTSLDESLMVEAAAGTGKTTVLIERIVAVLQSGRAKVHSIVAVTFTRKAAGELKLRLRRRLDEVRASCTQETQAARLEEAISHLEEARIGTIHSFCAELLRERPVEAGVDPAFVELSESEGPRFFDQAFRSWIQRRLNDMTPGLRRAMARLSQAPPTAPSPLERLREAGRQMVEWRDFPAAWKRPNFERKAEFDEVIEPILQLAEMSSRSRYSGDRLRLALTPARDFATWIGRAEDSAPRNYDLLEALLADLLSKLRRKREKGRGFFADDLTRAQVLDARQAVIERLERLMARANADLAALLQAEFRQLVEEHEELKRRSGKLDFVDLLIKTRDLIRGNRDVREHFQRRISRLFVDEFQDTDPLQAEILLLLAADDPKEVDWREVRPRPGALFLVGDPKQSIYRFRRADVLLYQEVRRGLVERGVSLVYLSRNFRSAESLIALINGAFESEMNGDRTTGQPEYVAMEAHRKGDDTRPSNIVLPVPFPYPLTNYPRVTLAAIEASLPDAIGAFVEWLLKDSGWRIDDPEKPGRRIELAPQHICLLFRRFMSWGRDVTRDYTVALEARGISHQLVGARSFHQREETETIKSALKAIEWPDDELSVFAALRGSLFAISDNLLLRFRLTNGPLHPFRPLAPDLPSDFEPIALALATLRRLHRRRNGRAVVETLNQLLEETRAHAGFALRPAGNQVLSNVQRICGMARAYELSGGVSFRRFVEQFVKASQSSQSSDGPQIEEGAEGVSIMTVHAAKGLEFPVVILTDMTARLSRRSPDKYVDLERKLCAMRILGCAPLDFSENEQLEVSRDKAEGVRIGYVAATRARDILVTPAVGDEVLDGFWLSPLNKAVYPQPKARRKSSSAPGCPDFGEASVLQRPVSHDGGKEGSVRPGLHRLEDGRWTVVWWDPSRTNLGVDPNFGLRQELILAEDRGGEASRAGLEKYLQWKQDREDTLGKGRRPTDDVLRASEATEMPPGHQDLDIQVEVIERAEGRPAGARFGTLVHTVLRDVNLSGDDKAVLLTAQLQGRLIGSPEQEIQAAAQAVGRALRHPLLQKVRRSDRIFRELPLLWESDDGRQLEGNIDLVFREEGHWTVVDFKTDVIGAPVPEAHRFQVAWYVKAVSELTQEPTHGVIVGL